MVMSSMQIAAMAPIAQQMGGMGSPGNYMSQITPPGLYGMGYGQMAGGNPMMGTQFAPPSFNIGIGTPPAPMGGGMPMGYMDPGAMARGGVGGMMGLGFGAMLPGTGGAQVLGERMTGTALNAASTMGAGLGWLNTGAGVASMLGVGGAGMAAMGALPLAGGLLAAGYGLNQASVGFQQRQQVNQVLRNRFGGMMGVGGGRGGMGFNADEMGGISSMVREMGTSDIFTNMEELTRVMDKTASMGLYRGIQSAKDFKDRFRQTIGTLKEIATTMNTTLEEATNFMQQGRQMGFFSGQELSAQLMRTRFGAGATGLSVGQVQQMGQIGSQMGRMMGMRGRQGARAMQGLGLDIAQGMEMGILSDEMMSEATGGLEGGEAATAMAQRIMQTNDRWLRQGAGRVMTAGLWDPETGQIDQAALRQVQSGQISLRELRARGRRNIAATGGRRSEFFAQEERIRGQLQESGGGMLMMGAVGEHMARRRGLELEDPIMQRWMRRRFRLSQSEVEAMTRLQRRLPEIQERGRARMRQQMEQAVRSKIMEGSGVAGLERRISQRWERKFEEPFRRWADELTTTISRGVENFVRDMEGGVGLQMDAAAKLAYEEYQRTGRRVGTSGLKILTNQEQNAAITRLLNSGTGGAGGGLAGMLGGLLGTRPTGDIRSQAEALGLGSRDKSGAFRLKGGRTPELGELQNLVRSANQDILGYETGVDVDSAQMARMGQAAAIAVTEAYSGEEATWRYGRRAQGASPAERKKMTLERIALLRRSDKEIDRYFAQVGNDFVKQSAALNRIEEESQVNRTYLAAPVTGSGVAVDDLAGIVRMSRERQETAIGALAHQRYQTKTYRRRVFGIDLGEGQRGKVSEAALNLSEEGVRGMLQNEQVSRALRAFVQGDPEQSRSALASLRLMAAEKTTLTDDKQREALRRLTEEELHNDKVSSNRVKHNLRVYFEQQDLQNNMAFRQREEEVGQEMLRNLNREKWRFEKGVHAKSMAKVRAIAEARARGDLKGARELEQAFLSDPEVQTNRGLQDELARIPGMEYLSSGLNATARVAERISRGGSGMASSKEARLIETALEAAGMEDLGLSKKQMGGLIEAAQIGKGEGLFMERLRTLTKGKGPEWQAKMQKQAEMFKQIALIMSDKKVEDKEIQEFAARFGQGAAARLRMEGAADKPPTSAQQEKMLFFMEKQIKLQMAIAEKTGKLDPAALEAIQNMKMGGTEPVGGSAEGEGGGGANS